MSRARGSQAHTRGRSSAASDVSKRQGFVYNRLLDEGDGTVAPQAWRLKAVIAPLSNWTRRLSTQFSDTDSVYPPWQLMDATDQVLDYLREFDPEIEDDPTDAETSFNTPGYVDRHSGWMI